MTMISNISYNNFKKTKEKIFGVQSRSNLGASNILNNHSDT